MKNLVVAGLESRKEWAKPELKKIDIEQITAFTKTGKAGSLYDSHNTSANNLS